MGHVFTWGAVAGALYGAMCLTLWGRQSRHMYYPWRTLEATPADRGLSFEDLLLPTADGETIHAWYVAADDAPSWTLIFCHGNGGNIGNRVEGLAALHELGLHVLMFDYRGYGRSTGEPTEAGTYEDVMTCWRYLTQTRGVHPENIVVFGESLGGAIAMELATRVQPGALVLEAAFTSAPDMAAVRFPIFPARRLCRFRYDSISKIGKIRCPVLIAHSRDDEITPFMQGRRLFEAAGQPKRFVEMSGSHNSGGILTSEHHHRVEFMDFLKDAASRA